MGNPGKFDVLAQYK